VIRAIRGNNYLIRIIKKYSLHILIIQTAFIGDVVLATGILEKLHVYFPDAKIDFLVRKGNEGLLKDHPFLNELLIWDKKAGKMKNLFKLLKYIRSKQYDKVINIQRFAATGILTAFSNAKEKIGYDKNPLSAFFTVRVPHIISNESHPLHEIDRCNDLVKHFTDDKVFKPKLHPSQKNIEAVSAYKRASYICIAPASVWFTKQYPAEKWMEFISKVSLHVHVYLIGAPGDKELCDFIRRRTAHPFVENLCGQYNFLQSAALQKDALMNYVNDSAPMHFASAVNAPVTAVYCSTLPSFGFGPLSDKSFIVEIKEPLECRPCGLHGLKACPLGHFNCAYKIEDDQLLNVLKM